MATDIDEALTIIEDALKELGSNRAALLVGGLAEIRVQQVSS